MSFKTQLQDKLSQIADKPENAFDKIISDNKSILSEMNENQLCEIYTLRNNSLRLCRIIPYSREDIASLIENNEVSPYNTVAELENNFTIAECIFARIRGEEY